LGDVKKIKKTYYMNYKARLIKCTAYGMEDRNVGDIVYCRIDEDGSVLLFSPPTKELSTFDVMFGSIEEAKQFATCISKTDFDVKGAWDRIMSNRYW